MSRYIFSKNNRWYISQVFDPSDSRLQEKASYYTLTDDITGPYYVNNGESDSLVPLEVSYAPVYSAGSDSLSFSKVTVTPGDVLAGKFFYTSGKVLEEGTIQTIVASLSANKVTIPRGFIESDSIIVPQADPLVVAGNTVTVPVGYIASQRVAEIPTGGSAAVQGNVVHIPSGYRAQSDSVVIPEGGAITVDGNVVRVPAGYRAQSDSISIVCQGGISIEAGYIDANGNFQPLSFNGTQASDSGSAVAGLQHKIFNTGHQEPDYGSSSGGTGSMDFYKCASRTIVAPYYRVSGAVSTPACNGDYYDTGQTLNNHPRYAYTDQSTNTTYYLQWNSSWDCWQIRKYSGESFDILFRQNTGSSYDTTQPTAEWNVLYNSNLPLTVTAMTPQTGPSWTGYKAIQDPTTGIYRFESTVTSGLTYSVVTPVVGKVYADGGLIEANLFTIPTDSLVLYASLNGITPAVAETGQTIGTIGSVNYGTVSGIPCADSDTTKTLYVDEIMSVLDPGIPKTLSCWVYITSWNGNNDGLAIFCCMQAGGGISIHLTSSACEAERRADSSYDTVSFGQLALNTWYHLAVTDDGNTMRTYRNGALITETQPTGSYSEAQDSINAGITGPGDSVSDFVYNLIGHMAAYRIYSRVLAQKEIAALAAEFTPTSN